MNLAGQHTIQLQITNSTSESKSYDLLDSNTSISSGVIEDVIIGNSKGSGGTAINSIGQTWLQTQTGTLVSISIYLGDPAMEYPSNAATLTIKNYDTGETLATYSVTYVEDQLSTFSVNVAVTEGVNYSFELERDDSDIFNAAFGTAYADGFMIANGTPSPGDNTYFSLDTQVEVGGVASDPDIEYEGDEFTYDEIVNSTIQKPIAFNNLTIIASSSDQLLNNLSFIKEQPYGDDETITVNVKDFSSPFDINNIVKIKFKEPIIFGGSEDQKMQYTVDGNSDVRMLFDFEFVPVDTIDSIQDTEYEIVQDTKEEATEDILPSVSKMLKGKSKDSGGKPMNVQETKNVTPVILGVLTGFILSKIITWIVKPR